MADNVAHMAGAVAREMDDLILLDSILRDSGKMTRANGALPSPGVPCQVNVDHNLDFSGMRIGLPLNFWATLDPAASPCSPLPLAHAQHCQCLAVVAELVLTPSLQALLVLLWEGIDSDLPFFHQTPHIR